MSGKITKAQYNVRRAALSYETQRDLENDYRDEVQRLEAKLAKNPDDPTAQSNYVQHIQDLQHQARYWGTPTGQFVNKWLVVKEQHIIMKLNSTHSSIT